MLAVVRRALASLLVLVAVPAAAQGPQPPFCFAGRSIPGTPLVVFDFEPVAPPELSPVHACFDGGPAVELRSFPMLPEAPGFDGTRFGAMMGPLLPDLPFITITFDAPLAKIFFPFQFRGAVDATLLDLALTTLVGPVPVGGCGAVASLLLEDALGVRGQAGQMPTCVPPLAFDAVRIENGPDAGAANVWIDGVTVIAAVPEPGTAALVATGVLLAGAFARGGRRGRGRARGRARG